MIARLDYWKANVAGLDDVNLLRFMAAVQQRRTNYETALEAAAYEARRRRLLPEEKGPAATPGQSIWRKL